MIRFNIEKLKLDIDRILFVAGVIALGFIISFFIWWRKSINVLNIDHGAGNIISVITGTECDNGDLRPVSVMMASDPIARPLSGIAQADIVFEMPVTPDGVTRMMAVFQCDIPNEIGSIRSAREDFIPLAAGLDSLYVHWGGERNALDKLNTGIVDNIDALKYEGTVFYRKSSARPPHNGFTNLDRIFDISEELGYDTDNSFSGYNHDNPVIKKNISNIAESVSIQYSSPYDVQWLYDDEQNNYKRLRNGEEEIDADNGQTVRASNIIVMETSSETINVDYIRVDIHGEGQAKIYQNGLVTTGIWQKNVSSIDSELVFYDSGGLGVIFLPGKIWVEIVTK